MTRKSTKTKTVRAKVVKIPNMKAKEFMEFINKRGACGSAKEWATGKTLKQVVKTCNHPDWLRWLFRSATMSGINWEADLAFGTRDNFWLVAGKADKLFNKLNWGDNDTKIRANRNEILAVYRKYYQVV